MAKEFGIPFYVCAPTSSIDLNTPSGAQIEIEQRDPQEIYKKWFTQPMAPEQGVKFYNPAFDVTSAQYITAIITEYGIVRTPYTEGLREIMSKKIVN